MKPLRPYGRRFYRMRLGTGALLSLPLALVLLWYAWSAFAQLHRYQRASEHPEPLDWGLFHIALHDELVGDLRRMSLPVVIESALPVYDLSLRRDDLDRLYAQLYDDGERDYVPAYVRKDGAIRQVNMRFRGSKPWHWLPTQKSMKLRLDRGDLVDGTRTFNLINEPTPFGLEDQIILDLARQQGLLAPEVHAARVRLNNSDLGVFRYAAQPTEGLLRRGRRVPGNLYSGDAEDLPLVDGVGGLFFSRDGWQQVAARAGQQEEAQEFAPLDRLLAAMQSDFLHFDEYARRELDLTRFATFDALDVAFGGDEHDWLANHKLYYDPYRGLFEPVAWSFRGFQHEPLFNLVDHPLLIRLKMTPRYLVQRNRALYELLTDAASTPQVRARVDQLFEAMATDLAADPYWDAYKLLPRVTRFHRFMVRPMSTARWTLAARAEIHGYDRRVRFLMDALERPGVTAHAERLGNGVTRLRLVADGRSAQRLQQITAWADCGDQFVWRADRDRDGEVDDTDPVVATAAQGVPADLDLPADLLPGTRLVERDAVQAKAGRVRTEPDARTYPFLLAAGCVPQRLSVVVDDLVTGRQRRLHVAMNGIVPAGEPDGLPSTTDVPTFAAGQRSPHLWDYPAAPAAERIVLGPDVVRVSATRVFAAHQAVDIIAGTRIEMAPGASLVFHGRLTIDGSADAPVRIVAAQAERPFGGVALQGPGTAGSRLEHLHVSGGSHVGLIDAGGVIYPSLLSIYDTHDIRIAAARFDGVTDAEDVIHTTYVRRLQLHEVDIRHAPVDGVDLEFTDGVVRGLRIVGAGDDCLDLMGADLRVADSVLLNCTNNAISAGEETDVRAHGVLIGTSDTAVLAKSSSRVRLSRSLIYRSGTALEVRGIDVHYEGVSSVGASDLFAVDCERAIRRDAASRLEVARIQRSLPGPGTLEHLSRHVLGLRAWSDLPAWVTRLQQEGTDAEEL